MAKTTAGVVVVAVVAVWTAGVATRSDAAPGPERVLVLHVTDFTRASRDDLAEAEQLVTAVYRQAGVRAIWTDGAAATAQHDGAFHVDVLLLSQEMVARKSQSAGLDQQVFGTALRPSRRAYIFYDRVADHARAIGSPGARLLGIVIAHEVGHLLLPTFSHSSTGVMRASWAGVLVRMPTFTDDQITTMQQLLAAGSGNESHP